MARLEVEIIGDSRSLEKAFSKSEKSAKSFNSDMQKAGKRGGSMFSGLSKGIGLVTGGLGVAGLAGAAHAAFSELADSQKVAAQTAAVLKSTGGAANVSARQVDALATSLMNKSGIDDEAIKSGENLLLTFTGVRNEVGKGNDIFDQATKAALDLSVRLGQDMTTSATQLGKALNDPIRGVGALRRVGVSFTADQQKLIKSLVESGHTLEAQKVILGELRTEYGGAAAAAGGTLPQKLNLLKETALNLSATIAQQLAPAITRVVTRVTEWLQNSKNQKTVLDAVKTATNAVATAARILRGVFDALNKITGSTKNTLKLLLGVLVAIKGLQMASAFAGMARSVGLLGTNAGAATTATRGLSGAMGKAGLAGAALAAGYGIGQLILKLPGMESLMRSAGSAAYDLAEKLNLVHDPGEQFKGKTVLGQRAASYIREQARRLEAGGMTPMEAAQRIAAQHPNVARHDIDVLAGGYARAGMRVHIEHFHSSAKNPRELQDALVKAHRGRPVRRRGDP